MLDRLDHLIIGSGLVLSGLSLLVLVWMLVNCWRREALPAVSYGGLDLPARRLRWIWTLFLLGALGFGVAEDPIFYTTPNELGEDTAGAESVDPGADVVTWSLIAPLPFIRYEREVDRRGDLVIREASVWSFLIPTPLLGAMFAYLVLVVWWRPDRPSARRLLLGRKAVRAERRESRRDG